jgi:RimJ/RimL family protein N-acetyltransferase
LRAPTNADLDFVTKLFARPELVGHRPRPVPDTPEQSLERLKGDLAHWRTHGFGRWAVEAEGRLVGFGGITVATQYGALNMSYHFHPDVWGRGYATELVEAALAFAFTELKAETVIGLTRPANPASRRVLEKCGFVFVREVDLHGAPSNLFIPKRFEA